MFLTSQFDSLSIFKVQDNGLKKHFICLFYIEKVKKNNFIDYYMNYYTPPKLTMSPFLDYSRLTAELINRENEFD